MLEFMKGDIFDAPADIRVNTVNCVGVMGAGVALAFKQRYPDMFKDYQRACQDGRIRPGKMHIWKSLGGDWIINFPTKRDWREPSRYEDISIGLDDLRNYLRELGDVKVALPALGCGHGGLEWNRVSEMIRDKLADVDAHVLVFEPAASRKAGRSAATHPSEDERKAAERLGYRVIAAEDIPALEAPSPLYVAGSTDILVRNWIALLPSQSPGDRELRALRSVATELAKSGAHLAVALVHGARVSEDVAALFLQEGVDTVMILPFGIFTRKSIPRQTTLDGAGRLTLVSPSAANGRWSRQVFAQSMDMLRANAAAALVSDPEPVWLTTKGLGKWAQRPISYIRYDTMPLQMRESLANLSARPIGRRSDDGAPNIDRLIDSAAAPSIEQRTAVMAREQDITVAMAWKTSAPVEKLDAQSTTEVEKDELPGNPGPGVPAKAEFPAVQAEMPGKPAESAIAPASETSAIDTPPSPHVTANSEVIGNASTDVRDFYDMFLRRLQELTHDDPMKVEDIAALLKLEKAQVTAWLDRGTSEGWITKLSKPVRYKSAPSDQRQASFFPTGI